MIPPAVMAPVETAPDTDKVEADMAPVEVRLLAPRAKVPATVRAPVLTAPVAVTVVHANDKADKAPVATTAAQLRLPVVVNPNVPALTIPPAVSAPVVAAPRDGERCSRDIERGRDVVGGKRSVYGQLIAANVACSCEVVGS
jgi:hypothetical protein